MKALVNVLKRRSIENTRNSKIISKSSKELYNMSILKIHIRNCYGIGSFDKEIDLSSGCGIIYAPNGTMKSSFTHVFQDIAS